MDLVQFSIWRFRNAEGVLDNVVSFNTSDCVLNVDGVTVKVTFRPDLEQATITYGRGTPTQSVNVKFGDFVKKMTELGFYKVRSDDERHSLSWENGRRPE